MDGPRKTSTRGKGRAAKRTIDLLIKPNRPVSRLLQARRVGGETEVAKEETSVSIAEAAKGEEKRGRGKPSEKFQRAVCSFSVEARHSRAHGGHMSRANERRIYVCCTIELKRYFLIYANYENIRIQNILFTNTKIIRRSRAISLCSTQYA